MQTQPQPQPVVPTFTASCPACFGGWVDNQYRGFGGTSKCWKCQGSGFVVVRKVAVHEARSERVRSYVSMLTQVIPAPIGDGNWFGLLPSEHRAAAIRSMYADDKLMRKLVRAALAKAQP